MTACVVGVDGGGSKTVARVAALDGTVLGEGSAGGSNWELAGVDQAVASIAAAVDAALRASERDRADVAAAAYGLAGVDWPADRDLLDSALDRLALPGRRWVDNDVAVALRAGCAQGWGVVSNVGTGTVTAGRDRTGRSFRTMAIAWGEPNGASGIARDAVHAVAAEHHGTAPPTTLTPRLLAAAGVADVADLFERLSRGRLRASGAWAPVIGEVAAGGDPTAQRILRDAGTQHGAMVVGVAHRLSMQLEPFDLALAGSVHHAEDPWFSEAFAVAVAAGCPLARPVLSALPAVQGAVLVALDQLAPG